jgi:Na+/H+ antiporter NhaD/arsenite permease-like protein
MGSISWQQSWTIILNLLGLLIFVAGGLGFNSYKLEPWVPEVGAIIVMIVNILLRYYRTSAPIERGKNTVKIAQ